MAEPIKTKRCSHCKQILPLSEFHKNRSYRDGLQYWCKVCNNQTQAAYQKTEKGKQTKKRYRQSKGGKQSHRRYNQSEKGKQFQKRYDKSNLEKKKARTAVNNAIGNGKMLPAHHYLCTCGKQAEHYHHHLGYVPEHRLDVIPLCRNCHVSIHKALGTQ